MSAFETAHLGDVQTMTYLHARDHARDELHEGQHDASTQTWERVSRSAVKSGPRSEISAPRDVDGGGRRVGVVVPSLTWPMMSPMLSGISHVLEQSSRELALFNVPRKHDRAEFIERMVGAKEVEGLIAIYPDGAASLDESGGEDRRNSLQLSEFHKQGFPVAIIDDQSAHEGIPWISADNRQGAMAAVRHLIRMGHRRIAHISGPRSYLCAQDRIAGYRTALAEAHLPIDHKLEIAGDFTAASGWAGAIYLLTLANPPTAIFAANDDIAQGALTAILDQGLRVPRQVAVVGFDDVGVSWSTEPPLTSVRQPFYDMGWWAAKGLVEALVLPRSQRIRRASSPLPRVRREQADAGASEARETRDHLELPVTLTRRQSSNPPCSVSRRGSSSFATLTPPGELAAAAP